MEPMKNHGRYISLARGPELYYYWLGWSVLSHCAVFIFQLIKNIKETNAWRPMKAAIVHKRCDSAQCERFGAFINR